MANRVRWGIISTARIGREKLIPAIQASRNGILVAVASRDLAKAKESAQNAGIERAYGSYEELLADPDVDAIYNPLPNDGHKPWTIAALKAGKPVLVEKPIAMNTTEAREMVALAREKSLLLAEAFMYRYEPQFEIVRRLLDQNTIGRMTLINASFSFSMPYTDMTNVRLNPEWGGGGLLDMGCYCVNLCRMIAGAEPITVNAFARYGDTNVDEVLAGTMLFPDTVLAHFDCGIRSFFRDIAVISGTEGAITLRRPFHYSIKPSQVHVETRDGRDETIYVDAIDEYRLMVEDFGDALQNGHTKTYDPDDSIRNMVVLDALARSARERQTVTIAG
jgi:predicted dehydrogenase